MDRLNTLWVEKYRPQNLDTYVGNDFIKDKVKIYLETGDVPHLLLHGQAGTGKTTLAKIIVSDIEFEGKTHFGYNVQYGNKEFFLGDMIKFQHLYNQKRINEVLYVCMTKEAVRQSYSGSLVTLEESMQLIEVFSKIFTFPVYFIGIDRI